MSKWNNVNSDIFSSRKNIVSEEYSIEESYNIEDMMFISEAIADATESKYVAKQILEELYEFNRSAEERALDAFEYIAEAFDIKGIVKKVFDMLTRFWGVIVNYIKTTFSKFTSSADLKKRLLALIAEAEALSKGKFNGKVKFKRFGLNTSVLLAGILLNAKTYIEQPLVKDDKLSSIARITAEATQLADVDLKVDRQANGEKQKAEATGLSQKGTTLKNLNDRLIAIIKSIGSGKSGTAGILLYLLGRQTIGTGADLKTAKAILDIPEIAKAKDATAFLKALLFTLFPGDAEIYETKDLEGEIKYIVKAATSIYSDSKSSQLASGEGNNVAISDDGFAEARKQAQDILDQLKSAGTKIGQFKANDVDTDNKNDLGAQKANESAANDVAGESGKVSANLLEIQTSMQEALTKGMDSGLVIIKTVLTELEFRLKSIRSLAVDRSAVNVKLDGNGKPDEKPSGNKGKNDDVEEAEIVEKDDLKGARDLDAR